MSENERGFKYIGTNKPISIIIFFKRGPLLLFKNNNKALIRRVERKRGTIRAEP